MLMRPFNACWTATQSPAITAIATAASATLPVVNRSAAARVTASTASTADTTRPMVMGCRPAGPRPIRSTTKELALCPATTATVKIATPIIGTTMLCTATKNPPISPANNCHQFNSPVRIAIGTRAIPDRIDGMKNNIIEMTAKPDPKLIAADSIPLPDNRVNSPFILA